MLHALKLDVNRDASMSLLLTAKGKEMLQAYVNSLCYTDTVRCSLNVAWLTRMLNVKTGSSIKSYTETWCQQWDLGGDTCERLGLVTFTVPD